MSDLPKIAFVDDDDEMRELMIALVKRDFPDVEVTGFAGGRAGLERVRAGGIALLITNCMMPDMDGPTLVREVRSKGETLPVIMISGSQEMESEAMEAGATRFVTKDRVTFELADSIRSLLSMEPE